MPIPIRLRTPNGQSRLDVDDEATLGELLALIKQTTGLSNISLKYSYPLKTLDIDPALLVAKVKDLGLRGETIVVASLDARPSDPVPQSSKAASPPPFVPKRVEPDETVVEWPEAGGFMGSSSHHFCRGFFSFFLSFFLSFFPCRRTACCLHQLTSRQCSA
jgi:ubiquitin thioesterase OTU1